jgi:hypothetical protein
MMNRLLEQKQIVRSEPRDHPQRFLHRPTAVHIREHAHTGRHLTRGPHDGLVEARITAPQLQFDHPEALRNPADPRGEISKISGNADRPARLDPAPRSAFS